MRLHLFRHGETDWNAERRVQGQSESRLTETGKDQARQLGQRLESIPFDAIYCSSSLRTRETAAQAFAGRDLEICYQDNLREIHMGPWEGVLYDIVSRDHPESFHHFWHEPHLFKLEGAESFAELQQRALSAITEIAERHPRQEVAVVSHGALIKSLLCHAASKELCDLWSPPHMHNCGHSILEIDAHGNMNILLYADKRYEPVQAPSTSASR